MTKVSAFLGDIRSLLEQPDIVSSSSSTAGNKALDKWNAKHRRLTEAIGTVLDDYSLVKFVPLEADDEDSITELLMVIDTTIQYGEDLDVKDRYPEEENNEGGGDAFD